MSVKPAKPPGGVAGTGWHCYVIGQGKNRIRGFQQGNIQTVTRAVEEIVAGLNERRHGKRGRVHIDLTSSSRKAGGS